MTLRIVLNRPAADPRPPDPPLKADGSPYRFEILNDGFTRRAYADTLTELCQALMPDYDPSGTDEDLAVARILTPSAPKSNSRPRSAQPQI